MKRMTLAACCALVAALAISVASAGADTQTPHPIFMPTVSNLGYAGIQPPPVELPPVCAPAPVDQCVPYSPPPAGEPAPVNMAYFGGHVQVTPKVYIVLWGWGQKGAFDVFRYGMPRRDPDGAAARMIAFLKAFGGTAWAGSQTQYYDMTLGYPNHIQNPANQFGGAWWDDANPTHADLSYQEIAQEAQRAVKHFHITDLKNSQIVVAQPQNYEDGLFETTGYCAWHDYTQPQYYPGVEPGISFTNMPYVLNLGTSCGENAVNDGTAGTLDGFTIVLGHEVEETITDPGAEDVINGQSLGGWYDYSGYENGDKCAWVGYTGLLPASIVPGGLNNITGNDGQLYPVQSLWSNESAAGAGYCAGAGDDLPLVG